MDDDRWQPDDALVTTLRTRTVPISGMSGPDRAWVVASLTVDGWTVAAIAARLDCSLRLIQQIKAEPMTQVAVFALNLQARLEVEARVRRLESGVAASALAQAQAELDRLRVQRDALLGQLARTTQIRTHP